MTVYPHTKMMTERCGAKAIFDVHKIETELIKFENIYFDRYTFFEDHLEIDTAFVAKIPAGLGDTEVGDERTIFLPRTTINQIVCQNACPPHLTPVVTINNMQVFFDTYEEALYFSRYLINWSCKNTQKYIYPYLMKTL